MTPETRFGSLLRSSILVFIGLAWTAYMSINTLIFSYITTEENNIHRLARIWAKYLLLLTSVRVQVIGSENIQQGRPQVFMVNHHSVFDIFVLLAQVPSQFRWVIKRELFKVPVFGKALRVAGYIELDRQHHDKALKGLDVAASKIRDGKSVMSFPEGTRSQEGAMKPFKQGIFYLAMQSGAPIVPISIIGTGDIMPKNSLQIIPQNVIMIIDKPVDVSEYSVETRQELIARVRDIIIGNYAKGKTLLDGKKSV
jgi:1-acyl-sn-glycerol-3-phosphate acyltransferase